MNIKKEDLINLDVTLAEIIKEHLVAFKNMERLGILYSKDWEGQNPQLKYETEFSDDTEWFLDELIWTFTMISKRLNDPPFDDEELQQVLNQIHTNLENEIGNYRQNDNADDIFNVTAKINSEEYKAYNKKLSEIEERIQNGLSLFSRYYTSLWD